MKTIRIFIASSAEMEPERKSFRDFLGVENDRLHTKGLYLELVQWEHFLDSVSQTSLQDEYNKELKKCDIVVCLFYAKAGKYTQLEFDTALKQFHETGSPLIYTYFKTGGPEPDPADEKAQEMVKFKKRLSEIGHFFTRFENTQDLLLQFRKQLDLIEDKGLIKVQEDVKAETKDTVSTYINTINNTNTANVKGNNNITNQGGTVNQVTINAGNQKAEKIANIGTVNGNLNF
jgi:hypothetical protein